MAAFETKATYENFQNGIIVSGGTQLVVSETGLCLGFHYGQFMTIRNEDARAYSAYYKIFPAAKAAE